MELVSCTGKQSTRAQGITKGIHVYYSMGGCWLYGSHALWLERTKWKGAGSSFPI